MHRSQPKAVTLDDILITKELSRRLPRLPNWQAEAQAMQLLVRQMAQGANLLKTLVEIALELCQAGTVGVSLLETTSDGEEIFRWVVVAGTLAHYVGGSIPGNFSPCRVCLEHGTPQLFSHPERYYTYLQAANTSIVEGLVLPLIADNHVFGTISIISHDENRHFDFKDVQVMTTLADFAAVALKLLQHQTQELLTNNTQLGAKEIIRNRAHKALCESEEYLRVMIENLLGGAAFVVDHNLRYLLAEGEALFAAGFTPKYFVGHTIFEVLPPELVPGYEALYRKGLAGESFEQEHNSHDRFYISRGTPLRSSDGEVYAVLAVSYEITERKQAEEALRESEEKYRSLFNLIDEGYFLCDVIFDQNNLPIDIFYLDANSAATRLVGSDFRGKRLSEISPNHESYWYEIFGRVAQTGEGTRLEQYVKPEQKWYDFYVFKIGKPDSRQVAVVFQDISDRKRRNANQVFLAEIADNMSRLSTAEEIMETVGAKIGAYLKVKSCLFVDVDDARGELTVFDAWSPADVPSLRYQTIHLADFINEEFSRANRSGEGAVVRDTRTDPRSEGKDYIGVGIRAFITVPFHRNGVWTNYLAVTNSESRDWRDDEIELFRELSNRIFPRLDRARAEAAQRETDARYQQLFNSIDEGFCIVEMIFDENEKPIDWLFLEANPAYEKQSGMKNIVGKTIREFIPDLEEFWVETYGRVVLTGESVRFEHETKQLNRWFDVFVWRVEKHESRKVAVVLKNVTERKQNEEALRESEARIAADLAGMRRLYELQSKLANQNDAKTALQDILSVACEFTGTARGCVQLLSSDGERLSMFVWQGYADDSPFISFFRYEGLEMGCEVARVQRQRLIIEDTVGFPSLEGTDAGAAVHADGIRASQSTPMASQSGETIGVISTQFRQPHRSSDHDLRLVDMLAWTAGEFLERHRADAALRESEAKYRSLFEAINDGFCLIEMIFDENEKPVDYRFLEISPSFERQTGMTNAQGLRMRELAPDHEVFWFEIYGNVALTGQSTRFENRAEQLDRWFEVYAFRVGEPENRQVTIVFNDITDRKLAEAERLQRIQEQAAREEERQRAETLAELDRAKTIFFSNVSHEFRTPLTLLLAPLQDALSEHTHPLAPPQRERLELSHRNALRLLKLVNTLLDFSRIEADRMEAVYEPTDLAMLTTELASVFRSAIEQAGLRLVVDCPKLPPVYVDRQMWEKIVLNLLSNAFKFTFTGEIAVRLHLADGNRVILQIEDTGTGIAPEHLLHLFERFYQVRGAKARAHEGSGIGLTLVNELIRLHGGTIDVSSTIGQGSCFTISLPLGYDRLPSDHLQHVVGDHSKATRTLSSAVLGAAPYVAEVERWLPEQGGDKGESSALSFASPAHVLLVDDNADMRDYLTRILSQYVQVEAVADGAAALAAAGERVPDLVLTDVMMPGLDGFGLLQALRADSRTREVPIILLSARAGKEAVIEGLQAGADDYLIKPFSAWELISRVNGHLQMAQVRSIGLQQERTISKRKDELLSVVSHELNTPLVSILGWARLLRSVPPSPAMLMKSLDTIERNAELQAKLIADLLDISRITAGKLRLNLEPVKLELVVANAITTVIQTAQAKGINLIWQATTAPGDTDSLVVMGDRDRLGQVICNLLTNAIKFTPESGSITIELLVVDDNNSSHAAYSQIRVLDTGIGIAADFLPHVFERFSQAKSGSAKGLGLGLAIIHHLVELHNGTIHAESSGVGQGATFVVKLPLIEP